MKIWKVEGWPVFPTGKKDIQNILTHESDVG